MPVAKTTHLETTQPRKALPCLVTQHGMVGIGREELGILGCLALRFSEQRKYLKTGRHAKVDCVIGMRKGTKTPTSPSIYSLT